MNPSNVLTTQQYKQSNTLFLSLFKQLISTAEVKHFQNCRYILSSSFVTVRSNMINLEQDQSANELNDLMTKKKKESSCIKAKIDDCRYLTDGQRMVALQ